jgi:hypothetical protein
MKAHLESMCQQGSLYCNSEHEIKCHTAQTLWDPMDPWMLESAAPRVAQSGTVRYGQAPGPVAVGRFTNALGAPKRKAP